MAVGLRVLAIDYSERRIGLAISDATRTLARPLTTLVVGDRRDALARVASEIERLAAEEDGVQTIVVGVPAKLDGTASDQTPRVHAFIDALAALTRLPIVRVDERLTSREAESRLAIRERDWRKRKKRLDAAAAAVMLQEYLDGGSGRAGGSRA